MHRNTKTVVALSSALLILAAGLVTCFGTEYTLIFKNESSNTADACVYQHDPDMEAYDIMTLAWFAKGAAPTTTLTFNWTIDYCFVWSEQGNLGHGVVFEASQIWDADPSGKNSVTLKLSEEGPEDVYTFTGLRTSGENGNLYIWGDKTLPVKQAVVGIGMSGAATHVQKAQPNWEWVYTPKPIYWITFGNFEPGEVLDVESISNKLRVHFERGVYSMTVVLHKDNTWSVYPTPN
jgi:rhizosphere induced protein